MFTPSSKALLLLAFILGSPLVQQGTVVEGCPYFRAQMTKEGTAGAESRQERTGARTKSSTRNLVGEKSQKVESQSKPKHDFFYARLVSQKAVPAFNEITLHELVSYGVPANETAGEIRYFDENSRTTSGFLNADPSVKVRGLDEAGAAAYTYMGQLLSHDLNLDETSTLGIVTDPDKLPNTNTPYLDLDTIYNLDGTEGYIVDGKFVLGSTKISTTGSTGARPNVYRDFPRDEDQQPIIADARNDDNQILSQFAVTLMMLHNKFYDDIDDFPISLDPSLHFELAKKETILTWQSIILTNFLPNVLDADILNQVSSVGYEFKLYKGAVEKKHGMPVEFSSAAYRLFHSRLAGGYRMNDGSGRISLFPGDGDSREDSLLGGKQLAAERVIDWRARWFGDHTNVQGAHMVDTLYSNTLLNLPIGPAGLPSDVVKIYCPENGDSKSSVSAKEQRKKDDSSYEECIALTGYSNEFENETASLAVLDLVRGYTHSLPGGIAMAAYVREELGGDSVDVLSMEWMRSNSFGLPMNYTHDDVPLIIYLGHESWADNNGKLVGKLGSLIIAETIYGLAKNTPEGTIVGTDWTSSITGRHEVEWLDVVDYIEW